MIPTHNTARSPVVHVNNIMSNIMLMEFADVRFRDLARGLYAIINETPDYRSALEHNTFGGGFFMSDIQRNMLKPMLQEMLNHTRGDVGFFEDQVGAMGKMLDVPWRLLKKFDKGMIQLYQMEDNVFKMAMYMRRVAMGEDPAMAAREAKAQFLDYSDINAPYINMLRRTVFPFIGYPYLALPKAMDTLAARPWKYAKIVSLAYAAGWLAYLLAPGDEDKERRSLRKEEQGYMWTGTPRMVRMPAYDKYGNPIFLNAKRWVVLGDVFDTNQGQFPILAPFQLSGPLMTVAEVALNRSGFTGEDIVNRDTADAGDYAKNIGGHVYKSFMPSAPWVYGSWYWDKIARAAEGGRDTLGRPYSIGQAVSSSIGIKVQPQDVEYGLSLHARELLHTQNELLAEANQLAKDRDRNLISPEKYLRENEDIKRKLGNLEKKEKEVFGR
jgi:hypothetical protein